MKHQSVARIALVTVLLAIASGGAFAAKPLKVPIDVDTTAEFVLDCGDFVILEDCSVRGDVLLFEDHLRAHVKFSCSAYNHLDPAKSIRQGPTAQNARWDFSTGVAAYHGLTFHITLPGHGKVFMNAGRIVFDADFGVLFIAGQFDSIDPDVEEPFCAALR